jgi:hypothetical protein
LRSQTELTFMTLEELKKKAEQVVREDFDPDLRCELVLEKTFEKHPLIDDHQISALFSFWPNEEDKLFVIVGSALPMIYPDYDLSADDLWAAHIGMEYFIKMGVVEDPDRKSPRFLAYLKMVSTVFQEQLYIYKPDTVKIEKVYLLNDQRHVVGTATFDDKRYTWIVGDIPHFVYKKELPPQIVWCLHMGRILRT